MLVAVAVAPPRRQPTRRPRPRPPSMKRVSIARMIRASRGRGSASRCRRAAGAALLPVRPPTGIAAAAPYYQEIFVDPHRPTRSGRSTPISTGARTAARPGSRPASRVRPACTSTTTSSASIPPIRNHILIGNDGGVYESLTSARRSASSPACRSRTTACRSTTQAFYHVRRAQDNWSHCGPVASTNRWGVRTSDWHRRRRRRLPNAQRPRGSASSTRSRRTATSRASICAAALEERCVARGIAAVDGRQAVPRVRRRPRSASAPTRQPSLRRNQAHPSRRSCGCATGAAPQGGRGGGRGGRGGGAAGADADRPN